MRPRTRGDSGSGPGDAWAHGFAHTEDATGDERSPRPSAQSVQWNEKLVEQTVDLLNR